MTTNTQTVSDITKIFRFYDIFDNQETKWCDVTINVKHLLYSGGQEFYDITYSYNYSKELDSFNEDLNIDEIDEIYRTNPFYYKNKIITSDMTEGVIVAKNSMTDEMVKYLLMDYTELDLYIGNTWNIQYKANVMFALAFMWD